MPIPTPRDLVESLAARGAHPRPTNDPDRAFAAALAEDRSLTTDAAPRLVDEPIPGDADFRRPWTSASTLAISDYADDLEAFDENGRAL